MSLSNRLGLPTEAIRGIVNKPADILQEDGAITNAPGHPGSAKMVISHSGKWPHLVLPKRKSGGISGNKRNHAFYSLMNGAKI